MKLVILKVDPYEGIMNVFDTDARWLSAPVKARAQRMAQADETDTCAWEVCPINATRGLGEAIASYHKYDRQDPSSVVIREAYDEAARRGGPAAVVVDARDDDRSFQGTAETVEEV